jgi:hypothetical protein
MQLKLFRHLWGVAETYENAFPKFKAFGYSGIECGIDHVTSAAPFQNLLAQHGFKHLGMVFTGGQTVKEVVANYRSLLEGAKRANVCQVTAHSGRDSWSHAEALEFYKEAVKIERDLGLVVGHETHRGRYFFNPWSTRAILEAVPEVKLCCDFSHWVVVAERLIDDCLPIIELCAQRCVHLHSRVGYEEGPQVPDPSAPEYQNHLQAHEKWWDIIWNVQQKAGLAESSLTPEFGPPNYMHTLPHTNVPVADLWKVCDWIADRQRTRFARRAS